MVEQPLRQRPRQTVQVDGEHLQLRHNTLYRKHLARQRVGTVDYIMLGIVTDRVVILERRDAALQVIHREHKRVETRHAVGLVGRPLEQPRRERPELLAVVRRLVIETAEIGRYVVAQVVDQPTLVVGQSEHVKLGEVLRIDYIRHPLEVVAAQIEILQLPEVLEVLVQLGQTVRTDGQTLQMLQLAYILARAEAELERIDVTVELQLLDTRKILHLVGQALLGREHVEPRRLDTALERIDISVHSLFPQHDVIPVVHLLARALPAVAPDAERARYAQQRNRVALARAALDLRGRILTDGETVVTRKHIYPTRHRSLPWGQTRSRRYAPAAPS